MSQAHPLPQINEVFTSFPLQLITHLRHVIEASTPSDAFTCYCNLLEWLTTYLANLANSVYMDRPSDQVDDKLESHLRTASTPISFGSAVGGLRALGQSSADFATKIPELAKILTESRLPPDAVRMTKAFQIIRKGREEYGIPPARLKHFLSDNNLNDKSLGKCSLDNFLSEVVTYRNKGLGHQAEESWFPRDPDMYALLVGLLAPALDNLLSWEPMRDLLTKYEIVGTGLETLGPNGARACDAIRQNIAEGIAPLGSSSLLLGAGQRSEGKYIARRTTQRELTAVARYHHFPQTLQDASLLYRQYARRYLTIYLERGLITKPQRQGELAPLFRRLMIPDAERRRIEVEIQQAINDFTPDDDARRDAALNRIATIVGHEREHIHAQSSSLLAQLPQRRKDQIFEQIDNNLIMSFEQLHIESELSEPDLDSVLAELEAERRVRRIGGHSSRFHAHFKAQDPKKSTSFRTLLEEFRTRSQKTKKYPALIWKLVELCKDLLIDDGIPIDEDEVLSYRGLFDGPSSEREPEDDMMVLQIGNDTIRADRVRELYERLMDVLRRLDAPVAREVPFLIGRTRYLVNTEPRHANGTLFASPVNVGGLYFEGNRSREQALADTIAFVERLGLSASSPEFENRREPADDDITDADEATAALLRIEILADDNQTVSVIQGSSVSRFFTALLEYLLEQRQPLDTILPVFAGKVRYLLSDEPYHANRRRFETYIERRGYYMNTAFSYEQAIANARVLCEQLDLRISDVPEEPRDDSAPLSVLIDGQVVSAHDVPEFMLAAVTALHEHGLLMESEIPYKSGRVRYLIAESPIHDHGGTFRRPVEIRLGDRRYYIEANISRPGAVELINRLLARKGRSIDPMRE